MVIDRSARVGFVGAGMVGKSLSVALTRQGIQRRSRSQPEPLVGPRRLPSWSQAARHSGRRRDVADATDFVFITSSDDAIGQVAADIRWRVGQGVAHCSGVASLDVLEPAARQGVIAGAFHPLQVFSSVRPRWRASRAQPSLSRVTPTCRRRSRSWPLRSEATLSS